MASLDRTESILGVSTVEELVWSIKGMIFVPKLVDF